MFTKFLLAAAAMAAAGGAAHASTVVDPTGDFLPSFTGPHQADLDVTSLSVSYNVSAAAFLIQSTMAGAIDPTSGGNYVIGVDTGAGAAPFGSIGAPNVKFNKAIVVQKSGAAAISGVPLAAGSVAIGGNALSLWVPLSLLPSTGFDPLHYRFNIWPRSGAGGTNVISDFAPNNATISGVPEPASWAMMVGGFGMLGGMLRRRRTSLAFG